MKKCIIFMLLGLMLFNVTACKKDPQVTTTNTKQADIETSPGTATQPTASPSADNTKSTDANSTSGKAVTNEGTISEIQTFIESFYYNFLFQPASETGALTETDLQLFAVSYIYQYEYQGLRFDSDKFVLYIPEENVTEVIKRFFDVDFTKHKYPENSSITYEDGYYLMKATNKKMGEKPVVKEVYELENAQYKVIFASSDANVKEHYEAIVTEKDNRWILTNYKKIVEAKE